MLNWVSQFNTFCFLDNHEYYSLNNRFECLVGAGSIKEITSAPANAFNQLDSFLEQEREWLFGHLGYDLKNEIENLHSGNFDGVQFPDLFFFIPEVVIQIEKKEIKIGTIHKKAQYYFDQIQNSSTISPKNDAKVSIAARFSREEYINTVNTLRRHILKGDLYEINFCQEFYSENSIADPLAIFWALAAVSPNPFAAFYKVNNRFLICESPERFLKKSGIEIISQPIKGTWPRNVENPKQDIENKTLLQQNAKEKAENIMVVDLVRNDLSKICLRGSVLVEELFGAYSYPMVHQLISTIKGRLKQGTRLIEIFKATFPMGSMTGAPKVRVMELIEKYERTKRGIFSGAVGYISPERDFDFNVIIRSILYNADTKYLSYQVGSGITYNSDAEKEYEECLLKARAIKKVLGE